jgi:membrane dipeptidase
MIRGQCKISELGSEGHIDIPRLKIGGVGLQFFAAYIEPQFKPGSSTKRALELLDVFYAALRDNGDSLMLIESSADIEEARRRGKIGALLSIEGGEALEGSLSVLRMFYRLGFRAIGLTWNERNQIADGLSESRTGGGLTEFGIQVIQEMNRLGMIIDVSHISERGFWDCIELSRQPIIASHSNAKAVCGHVRNLSDEQIVALSRGGGVMGINLAAEFVRDEPPASIDHVVDHIEHIVRLVGSKHVGLGTDYDGIRETPVGLEDVAKLPTLTEALIRRGFSEPQIRDILGGNFLRVIGQVLG